MKNIHLLMGREYGLHDLKSTGFVNDSAGTIPEVFEKKKLEILFQSSEIKGKSDFLIMPLNKVKISDPSLRIISVSKRMAAFDRLLIPENFVKKIIPVALRELPLAISEERTLLQLKELLPGKEDIYKLDSQMLFPGNPDLTNHAVILPWQINTRDWLDRNYSELELHPAEFTPEPGSGCWVLAGDGSEEERLKELIRSLHHPASLVFTNTERKLLRDFDLPDIQIIGAHLESLAEDNYHLYICLRNLKTGKMSWHDYPSSTFGDMATDAIRSIKISFEHQTLN